MGEKLIMVVDDEKDNRDTVETILKTKNYAVITAENGDDCLRKLKKTKVDLILLDIMMPKTPVAQVIKKIKDTKIVFVSAVRTSEAEREKLMQNKNIRGFVQKPYDVKDLLAKVEECLS